MKSTMLQKTKLYWPVIVLAVLFGCCYWNAPLVADQYVSNGLYIDAGGFANYVTGYCLWWLRNVNARFFSVLICGIVEQNVLFNRIGMMAVVLLVPILGMFALKIQKNRPLFLLLTCTLMLIIGAGIQREVYFYAGLLYMGVVVLTEAIALLTAKLLDENPGRRLGYLYLAVALVAGLWLETFTAALFVTYVCLTIYHYWSTRKVSRWLVASVGVSGVCLYLMMHQRGNSLDKQTMDLRELISQGRQVLDALYLENAGITAMLGLLAALFFAIKMRHSLQRRARVLYAVSALALLYIGITHALQAYNVQLAAWQSAVANTGNINAMPSGLLYVVATGLLPPANNSIRFFLYLLLTLFLLLAVVLQHHNREYLILYCVSFVNVGVVSVTSVAIADAMGGIGARMLAPSVLLLAVLMAAITADALQPAESERVVKILMVSITVLFLLKADDYYARFSLVGKISRENAIRIESCVEQQRLGTWDIDTDTMVLKSIPSDLLDHDLEKKDPRYPFFCRFYGLDEETLVAYE